MKPEIRASIVKEGGKIISDLVRLQMAKPSKKPSARGEAEEGEPQTTEAMIITQEPAKPPEIGSGGDREPPDKGIATACVACALGHFSTSAGLLDEAVRFKGEGITSNAVLDRIAKTLQELNALERVDLTPEKLRTAPDWERDIAEEALQQSRGLRHRLETIKGIEDLEAAAADTAGYYRSLHREWWKRRLAKTDEIKPPEMTLDEAKKLAADEAAKEVEARWHSLEKK